MEVRDPVRQLDPTRWRVRATQVIDWLLPPTCLVCGQPGGSRSDLCPDCARAMIVDRQACCRCALPLPNDEPLCGRCLRRAPAFDACHAAARYAFPIDRLLPRFKFHGDLAAGRVLAHLLTASLADHAAPQALIPVPLHPERLRTRGYNQSLELARAVGRARGVPVCVDGLRRLRATAAQSELGAQARRRNVRNAFAAGTLAGLEHVALIDDVMTTGATVEECARTLKRAGIVRVDVWVVARAEAFAPTISRPAAAGIRMPDRGPDR